MKGVDRRKPQQILELMAPFKQEDMLEHEGQSNNLQLLHFNVSHALKYSLPSLKYTFFLHNTQGLEYLIAFFFFEKITYKEMLKNILPGRKSSYLMKNKSG